MTEEDRYTTTYAINLHPDGITRDEIGEDQGACDSLVVLSIIGTPGGPGPLSVATVSYFEGTAEDIPPDRLFNVWFMWTFALKDKLSPGNEKAFLEAITDALGEAKLRARTERNDG